MNESIITNFLTILAHSAYKLHKDGVKNNAVQYRSREKWWRLMWATLLENDVFLFKISIHLPRKLVHSVNDYTILLQFFYSSRARYVRRSEVDISGSKY